MKGSIGISTSIYHTRLPHQRRILGMARTADVDHNLECAERLLDEAFGRGCEMVVLPEFFTSAAAFHPHML